MHPSVHATQRKQKQQLLGQVKGRDLGGDIVCKHFGSIVSIGSASLVTAEPSWAVTSPPPGAPVHICRYLLHGSHQNTTHAQPFKYVANYNSKLSSLTVYQTTNMFQCSILFQ